MLKILIGIISKQTEKVGDSLNALSNLIMNLMDKMDADFPHSENVLINALGVRRSK